MLPVNAPRKPHGNEIALKKNATRYAYASINNDRNKPWINQLQSSGGDQP